MSTEFSDDGLPPDNTAPSGQVPTLVAPVDAAGQPQPAAQFQMASPHYDTGGEDEVDLWEYLAVISRRRWTVAAVFVFCVMSAAIFSVASTPMFSATSLLEIQPGGPNIVGFDDIQESVALSQAYNDYFQTQYDIMSSRRLARRVITKLDLDEDRWLNGDDARATLPGRAKQWLGGLLSVAEDDPTVVQRKREQQLVEKFRENVRISPRRRSYLVEASFISPDPHLSSRVADEIATEYIDLTLDHRIDAASQGRDFIAKQLAITKARLEESEVELHHFARGKEIYALEQEEEVIHERLADLNTRLTSAEAERIRLKAMLMQARGSDWNKISPLVNSPLLKTLAEELASVRAEYAAQAGIFTEEFPRVRVLRARINEIEDSIEREEDRLISSIETDYGAALERESMLHERLDSQRTVVADYEEKAIDFKILRREVDTNRSIYESLLMRMKEVEVSEAIRASNITIIDRPEVPLEPVSPNVPVNLALSMLLGLFGGVGIAFFQDYMDDSVKTPDDVERYLRLPTLGAIPEFSSGEETREDGGVVADLEVVFQPTSAGAEAIRTLRASLFLAAPGGVPSRLLITSAKPGEGKTTIGANLAAALAQMGRRVAVIDCDLRRPRVHKAFAIPQTPGVTNFLTGNMPIDEIRRPTQQRGLDVFPAGPLPPNPVDLLDSVKMGEFIRELEERYDHVIVDAPPALGFADVPVLNNRLDGACLLVTRSGETSWRVSKQASEYLIRMQSKLLGVVLNRVSNRSSRYSYYGYYGQYGDYYASRAEDETQEALRETA